MIAYCDSRCTRLSLHASAQVSTSVVDRTSASAQSMRICLQSASGTLSSGNLMSETSEDAVTIKQPRSVFLSPTKVARMSISSMDGDPFDDAARDARGACTAPALVPQPESQNGNDGGSPHARSCVMDTPSLHAHPLPEATCDADAARAVLEATSSVVASDSAAANGLPAHGAGRLDGLSSMLPASAQPLMSRTGFAPLPRAAAAHSSETSPDKSPLLVDVLRSSGTPPVTSQLTAALEQLHEQHGSRAAVPQHADSVVAGSPQESGDRSPDTAKLEAGWELVSPTGEAAQNGKTPSGSLGSLTEGLLKRFSRLHSPKS